MLSRTCESEKRNAAFETVTIWNSEADFTPSLEGRGGCYVSTKTGRGRSLTGAGRIVMCLVGSGGGIGRRVFKN